MDDQQVGIRIQAARVRRGWTQRDLAAAAGVSDGTGSRIERGHVGSMSIDRIRSVCAALEIRLELVLRARSGDLDRLVSRRHAALADQVLSWLGAADGWVARAEVSFSEYGERGVIDVLAWHAATRTLLVIEIKTEVVDVGELLGTLDRKVRLAPVVAGRFGWRPLNVASWLVVADGRTNHRRVAAHRATFDSVLPARGRALAGWLRRPVGTVHGLSYMPDRRPGSLRSGLAGVRRVRRVPQASTTQS